MAIYFNITETQDIVSALFQESEGYSLGKPVLNSAAIEEEYNTFIGCHALYVAGKLPLSELRKQLGKVRKSVRQNGSRAQELWEILQASRKQGLPDECSDVYRLWLYQTQD